MRPSAELTPGSSSMPLGCMEIGNWRDDQTPAMRPKLDVAILWRRAVWQSECRLTDQERANAGLRIPSRNIGQPVRCDGDGCGVGRTDRAGITRANQGAVRVYRKRCGNATGRLAAKPN
jgi:hypothetical protein